MGAFRNTASTGETGDPDCGLRHVSEIDVTEQLLRLALGWAWTPIGAVMMVKCLDEEGRPTWPFRTAEDMSDEEVLGALGIRAELQRRSLIDDYTDPDDD